MSLTNNEKFVLVRVAENSDLSGIFHLKKEFKSLKILGLIDYYLDEQGNIMRPRITTKGKSLLFK